MRFGIMMLLLISALFIAGCIGGGSVNQTTQQLKTQFCQEAKDTCQNLCDSQPDTEKDPCKAKCDDDYYICKASD